MDVVAKIAEEEWTAKREVILAEDNSDGARDAFAQGIKDWIASDFHMQRRNKTSTVNSASTKVVYIDD
jgi:hypothetical protein